jgi:hypothetical protein
MHDPDLLHSTPKQPSCTAQQARSPPLPASHPCRCCVASICTRGKEEEESISAPEPLPQHVMLGQEATGFCFSLLVRQEMSGYDSSSPRSDGQPSWVKGRPPSLLPTLTSATIRWYCGSCCPSDATSTVLNLSGSCLRCWATGLFSCWGRSLSCSISSNSTQLLPCFEQQSTAQMSSRLMRKD